jgi:phosphatidylethanolamine/phosphatidyl-N-methylethanolamine N-methyltransferase
MSTIWDLDTVKDIYGKYAGAYDIVCGWAFAPGRKIAANLIGSNPGTRVLEVGVGTGASLKHYPLTTRVTGIDISVPMLEEARKRQQREQWPHVEELQVMDAEAMNFADDSFDAVVAMHIATVVPNPARFMAEMRRVCKPGGKIVIVSYFDQKRTAIGRIASGVAPMLGKVLGFRASISYEEFLKVAGIQEHRRYSVNLFKLWMILEITNSGGSELE